MECGQVLEDLVWAEIAAAILGIYSLSHEPAYLCV